LAAETTQRLSLIDSLNREVRMTHHRRAILIGGVAVLLQRLARAEERSSAFKVAPGPFGVKTTNPLLMRVEAQAKDLPLRVTTPDGPGPFPLVVFSHGALSSKDLYTRVIDHWASHGYAAIQPTHIDSESLNFKFGSVTPAQLLNSRIGDMQFILDNLDAVADQAGIVGKLDKTKIAVSGHSFGGQIALIMAGLPLMMQDGSVKSFGDKRVKALVSYNGTGPMDRIANDKWSEVTVPVFASSGTNDPGATGDGILRPWRWRIGAYDFAGSKEKYAVSIAMGDHYYGGLICREGAGGKPDPEGLSYTNGASTAFLDAYLKGDAVAKKFLRTADLPALTDNRAFLERT
jgi:dienelactone hydrolase